MTMKSVLAASLSVIVFISCSAGAIAGCRTMTGDQGRWRDPNSPSGEINDLCVGQQNYHQGEAGKMIFLNSNPTDCKDLIAYAKQQDHWNGDWFLWSEIKC